MDCKLLERICEAPGVSGFERAAQSVATDVLTACCDEVRHDALGNIVGLRKATKPPTVRERPVRLMLDAHVDECGLMVKHILANGLIHFIPLGGVGSSMAQSQRVVIHGRKPLRGVIVPRLNGEDEKPTPLPSLLIDTGLTKEEVEQHVEVGDVITFDADVSLLNGRMWVGRNFDNRIGSYCLLEAMRQVGETSVDVYAASTVQEEVGLRGARPAAFGIDPDVALAIDGSMARGAYVADHDNLCDPGKGTGIYLVDKLTIGHPGLVKYLCGMCDRNGIPYQRNIGGGTDAAAIQQSRAGVITTTVGAPVRYMHSTVQLCHADDMDATVALLVKFMETAHGFMASLP